MADAFDSAWLKWGWAVRHADLLQANIAAYRAKRHDGRIYTTRREYDPKRHCISLRVATIDPIPDQWSLVLGDVIQGYRSCLDHVAWSIYKRGKTPNLGPKREKSVGFPVKRSTAQLKHSLPDLLPGIRRADEAIVRRYQPYRVAKTKVRYHVLVLLVPMSNFDKHRTIKPLFAVPGDGYTEVSNPRDCVITRLPITARRIPLKEGAELHRVYVRKTGLNPRIDIEAYITPFVAINEEVEIHEWLTQARSFTYQLLSEFQSPPSDRLLNIGLKLGTKGGLPSVNVIH